MRTRMFAPALATLAALLPLAARASTTTGDLALDPGRGAPGSHFTATFTFTEAPCNAYTVYFYWDAPNPGLSLGGVDATGSGPTCRVSMDLVVPSTDASPNHSYPVLASAQTKQVNAGGGSVTNGSTKDSGSTEFEVTSPPSGGASGSGPTPSAFAGAASNGTSTGPTAAPTSAPSGTTGGSTSTGEATTTAGVLGAPAPPDAADATPSPANTTKAPPLTSRPPHAGSGGTILVAVILLVLLIALGGAYRAGALRTLLRR